MSSSSSPLDSPCLSSSEQIEADPRFFVVIVVFHDHHHFIVTENRFGVNYPCSLGTGLLIITMKKLRDDIDRQKKKKV